MLVPFLCLMVILEEEAPCMVPIIIEGKAKTLMLLAMQLEKGLKKNEMTYLEALNFTPPPPTIGRCADHSTEIHSRYL